MAHPSRAEDPTSSRPRVNWHPIVVDFAPTCGSRSWVDLDDLRRAGRLARHAVDAVRLADHVGLVTPILVPLVAAFLDDLVVPRAFLAGGEKPLEDVDGTDVHADAVGDAAIEVDGHVETVDPEFRGIRGSVRIGPRDALGIDLVVEVGPGLGVDRKSTRLNSSHRTISYAVFCLKKKSQ